MQPMQPIPTSKGSGFAAAFRSYLGGRGGMRSAQGEKLPRPNLGPCLFPFTEERRTMDASGSFAAANAIVDAFRRGDEAKAVGLINNVTEAAHLGLCLLSACETSHPKCTRLLLAARAAIDQADSHGVTPLIAACFKGDGGCEQQLLSLIHI